MITPGLRGFVLSQGAPAGDSKNPARDPLPVALDALAHAFTVVDDRGASGSGTRRRIWLDTFDWRLYRAGLVLEFERVPPRGGRLLLTATDGTPQAEQPVTGWPPRRPALAQGLPAGQVRDRIVALTSPRALLPVVGAISAITVMRLLNEDGKTVARLVADRSTVTGAIVTGVPVTRAIAAGATPDAAAADTTAAELPPRLAITEVRGYPGPARRAAALLAALPGVSPASQSAFEVALHALGRHPAADTSGLDTQITAQLPASAAVARLLLGLLDTLELNVDGVLRDIDTEFLHDLRVAVRRSRSAIKLLGAVLPAGLADTYGAEFKWLGDLTTPTRDLDVHLLGFDALAGQLLAATPADLEPFRAFLVRRRAREFRRLAVALRSPRFRALTDDWRKALLEVRDGGGAPKRRRSPGKRRETTAAELAISTTGRAFRRIAAQGAAITPQSAPQSLHDLRKRGKELRYLLEFFAPLHDPAAYRKVVGDLKQLQDCLGDFQDSEVQREEIGVLASAMLAERAAPAATLLAMGELAARLAVSQAEARADFSRRFARFAGPAGQQRVRVLLGELPAPAKPQAPAKSPDPAGAAPVKIYATYNIKGGVGKTTAAVNLAYLSAADGQRTLLWDLDPQGAASFLFRIKPRVKGGGKALIRGTKTLDDAIKGTDFDHLDLIPSDFTYRHMDLLLGSANGRQARKPAGPATRKLAELLKPFAAEYDAVFLDCPPGISLVSENVMHAADVLLVPVIPATLSVRTLNQLTEFVAGFNGDRPDVRAFFSMVDRRKKLHQDTVRELLADHSVVTAAAIPSLAMIERMSVERTPVTAFAPRSQAARAYRALWSEVR